jgi:hypothetical protein
MEGRREGGRREVTLIKPRDPHLAGGGEKKQGKEIQKDKKDRKKGSKKERHTERKKEKQKERKKEKKKKGRKTERKKAGERAEASHYHTCQ